MTPSGKYYAAVLIEIEGSNPTASTDGKIAGIDLGLKDFAIVNGGEVLGTRTAADGGDVSPRLGRKSKLTQSPVKSEA